MSPDATTWVLFTVFSLFWLVDGLLHEGKSGSYRLRATDSCGKPQGCAGVVVRQGEVGGRNSPYS